MRGKTCQDGISGRGIRRCFNEAPHLRGERLRGRPRSAVEVVASMRPRIYAGKDERSRAHEELVGRASMRPRIYAGKDRRDGRGGRGDQAASMRPRIYAGKDAGSVVHIRQRHQLQ